MNRLLVAAFLTALSVATPALAWWQDAWPYRKTIAVDTSATGLNVAGAIGRTPVLVRLHSGNFQFGDVLENGADLRFVASDDKTPLTYHIESFDPLLGVANIWVDVPRLAGGEKQDIFLYYGNKSAPAAVDTAATFDPDYALVLHYDEAPGSATTDKSSYKNNPVGTPSGIDEGAVIGRGAKFAASSGLSVPASPSLIVPANGGFTFSTWVKVDALEPNAALFSRDGVIVGLAAGIPYAQIGATRLTAAAPLTAGQWAHVALASGAGTATLYVNGAVAGTGAAATPALSGPLSIGGAAGAPFSGTLDETRFSKVARPAALVMADANGQGAETRLLAFGADEQEGGGESTIMFILKATPMLDWFIIGLCMVLLALAIAVMAWKGSYLGKAQAANARFMKRFHALHENLVPIDRFPNISAAESAALKTSPLGRLYETGIEELEVRTNARGDRPLTGEAVEALRAAIDAEQVAENQKFDKWMVLLTITISGGPFIGLLGTVLGVMNTFGGVALAGEVNVNAIAPGIAAALLATIAGLAAAIPALFGYNYLNSRISAMADEMRVFVDRLVTRLAEMQSERAYHNDNPPAARIAAE